VNDDFQAGKTKKLAAAAGKSVKEGKDEETGKRR